MSVIGIAVFSLLVLPCYGVSKEGDRCIVESTGKPGVCTLIGNCSSVLQAAFEGVAPQVCSLKGTVSVVCCESSTSTCSPLPSTAVTIPKTGAKARDYCISLAEAGYPCIQTIKGWTRKDICPVIPGKDQTERHVDTSDFPHLVALSYDDNKNSKNFAYHHLGSLISDQWVMTEEYCARSAVYAKVGGLRWNAQSDPELVYSVKMRFIHPDFNNNYNDIGLLKLERKVTFSKTVFPACLHAGTPYDENELTYISQEKNIYFKMYMKTMTYENCAAVVTDALRNASQMCVKRSYPGEINGISGSPLQTSNDREVDCTQLIVGVHAGHKGGDAQVLVTRVYGLLPWIENVVWP